MPEPKPYRRTVTGVSTWIIKAIGLVIAGAATVIVAMTITKSVSTKVDPAPDGKFVGIRHDAALVAKPAGQTSAVSVSDQSAEPSANTVVRNGVTVVSPQLLVPVIDTDWLATTTANDSTATDPSKSTRNRTRYTSRSRSYHHPRWRAFGFALR